MKYYHVTLLSNIKSIFKDGLLPKIGERSREIGEREEAVYLFPTIEDMEEALMNWLGDWYTDSYGENIPLGILEINLPKDFEILDSIVEYEKISKKTIPPQYISLLREE